MKLFSPAKINLFLHILRKRPDGFHEIETLFERISLGDQIILKPHPSKIIIRSNSDKIPVNQNNLAYKAAFLLRQKYGIKKGVIIRIKKIIPVAAGLGGGSSNAATVLLGLNRLWKLKLSQKKLLSIGSKLGSDVAFFILNTPRALGQGRGEKLRPVRISGKKLWYCLVKPDFGISTKEAYANLKPHHFALLPGRPARRAAGLTPLKANVKMLLHSIEKGDSEHLSEILKNSLELTLNNRVTTIFKIKKELLRQGAIASLMSGSGSTVFGIFSSDRAAHRALRYFKKYKSWQVFSASTY